MIRVEADADRRRDHHILAVVELQRLLEGADQLLRNALGLDAVGQLLEDDGELVAADAGDRVAIAYVVAQAAAGGLQHAVASSMTH